MASSPSTLPVPSLEDVWNGKTSLSEYTESQERKDPSEVLESDTQVSKKTNQPTKVVETQGEAEHTCEKHTDTNMGAKDGQVLPPGRLPIGTLPQPKPIKEKPPIPLKPGPLGSGSQK